MKLPLLSRTKKPTDDETYHQYVDDLADLTKLREKAMQRMVLQNTDATKDEVARYDKVIEIAQKSLIRIQDRD